jgi:Initiator Replication protein
MRQKISQKKGRKHFFDLLPKKISFALVTDKHMNEEIESGFSIEFFQNNPDYLIFNNPLANPKFIRRISKNESVSVDDIYTRKLFIEIASRLKPSHLFGMEQNESVCFTIHIKDFLERIGVTHKKGYNYLIESAEMLQTTLLKWREGKLEVSTTIISQMIHDEGSGKIQLFIVRDLAQKILEVNERENFSFLKENFFRLQNSQSIKLYPFFKSWLNKGFYEIDIERFKIQFEYNTSGYLKFSNLEKRVLIPAIEEINEKTDIFITYQKRGTNLDRLRPKIVGLLFIIKLKQQPQTADNDESLKMIEFRSFVEREEPIKESAPVNENIYLYQLFKKINVVEKPEANTIEIEIDAYVEKNGRELVEDCFIALIDKKVVVRSMAYFSTKNLFEQHQGYSKQKKKKIEEKQQKLRQEAEKSNRYEELKRLVVLFKEAELNYFERRYDILSDISKHHLINEMMEAGRNSEWYFDENKQPTQIARQQMGMLFSLRDFSNPYNRLEKFQYWMHKEGKAFELSDDITQLLNY